MWNSKNEAIEILQQERHDLMIQLDDTKADLHTYIRLYERCVSDRTRKEQDLWVRWVEQQDNTYADSMLKEYRKHWGVPDVG